MTTPFCIQESDTSIGSGMSMKSWFVIGDNGAFRRETYHAEDGSVVAYQDYIQGKQSPLYLSSDFKKVFDGEPELNAVIAYAGHPTKIELFRI